LVPLNETIVVIVVVPWGISKRVRHCWRRRHSLFRRNLPLVSRTSAAWGFVPLVPLNDATVVIELLPLAISKIVPSLLAPPAKVGAVEVAAGVEDQRGLGVCAVGAGEQGDWRDCGRAMNDLKDPAVPLVPPPSTVP